MGHLFFCLMKDLIYNFVQSILPPFILRGYHFLKETFLSQEEKAEGLPIAPSPVSMYHGLHELDRLLEKTLDYDHGFFVELGANDGETQSNTFYFEKNRNWRGVLVEPILHNYLHCRKVRSLGTKIFCAACVGFDYQE